jgi:uncharacterized sulfatase
MVLVILAAAAALALPAARARAADEPAASPRRPNILFVLIDDMGYHDLSCFGGTRVQTPRIDQLASQGIKFTQFYVSAPICSPSRVALTTGQTPNRWHITSFLNTRADDQRRGLRDWLSLDAPSLARFLHDAGYYTAHVGKWHMGGQRDVADAPMITQYGFDYSITNFEGLGPRILAKFAPHPDGRPFHHGPTEMSAKYGIGPITWVDRWDVTAAFVDHALEQMKIAQKQGKPFYINLWPDDVHSPCQAPPGMRGDNSPAANYCGVLAEADKHFGRAFDYVRSQPDLRDNTVIVVCSDNGPERGLGSAGDLRGSKGQLYEGGIRSPLIVWAPGLMPKEAVGTHNDTTLMAGIDFAPSVLAITGVKPPPNVKFDGQDFSGAWLGKAAPSERHQPLMWVRPPDRPGPRGNLPDVAIRDGKWKLLVHRDGSRVELFDVRADPNETKNLAEEHPDVAGRLKQEVLAWDKSIGQ